MSIVERLRRADPISAQRAVGSALLADAADEIERLQAEVVEWKKAAGKYVAGCDLCEPTQAENERLRAALKQSLRQWNMYADMVEGNEGFELAKEKTPEGDIYRAAYALAYEQRLICEKCGTVTTTRECDCTKFGHAPRFVPFRDEQSANECRLGTRPGDTPGSVRATCFQHGDDCEHLQQLAKLAAEQPVSEVDRGNQILRGQREMPQEPSEDKVRKQRDEWDR